VNDASGAWHGRIAVALLLVMVFAAGMITDAWVRRVRMEHAHTSIQGGHPPFGADRDRHFGEELGLDSAQRVRVDSVFARRRVQIDSFWKGPGRSLRAIMDSTRQEVRAVLTPEQRTRFDRRRMEGRPRHPEDAGPSVSPSPQ
jgi:Spy/CpxP family protein refolding chaperone